MIKKRYILVDGENIAKSEYKGLDKLTHKDTVVIFNSIFAEGRLDWKTLYEIQQRPKKEQPTIIHSNVKRKVNHDEKDKMDYYMIAHLTELLAKDRSFSGKIKYFFNKDKNEYCIISKDKGFDKYINYFKDIYGETVLRFNNFNELNRNYNKNNINVATNNSSLTAKNLNNSDEIKQLSLEVKTLTKIINDLNNKIENNDLNSKNTINTTDNIDNNVVISNTSISNNESISSLNSSNTLVIDTLISKEKITNGNTLIVDKSNSDISDINDSKVVYLCDFKDIETSDYSEGTDICSAIVTIEDKLCESKDDICTSKSKKSFNKINLEKFIDNYSQYPKKKKLLRDEYFIKTIFKKHGLYDKYNKKSLDKFAKDCDSGLINIKTMSIRIEASFPPNSINDFRPALNEIIKYQIKNNIM